jgi:hypothetical protein
MALLIQQSQLMFHVLAMLTPTIPTFISTPTIQTRHTFDMRGGTSAKRFSNKRHKLWHKYSLKEGTKSGTILIQNGREIEGGTNLRRRTNFGKIEGTNFGKGN